MRLPCIAGRSRTTGCYRCCCPSSLLCPHGSQLQQVKCRPPHSACCAHSHLPPPLGSAKLTCRCATSRCCWISLQPDSKNLGHHTAAHLLTKRSTLYTTCIRPLPCTRCARKITNPPRNNNTLGSLRTCLCPTQDRLQSQQTPAGCQKPAHTANRRCNLTKNNTTTRPLHNSSAPGAHDTHQQREQQRPQPARQAAQAAAAFTSQGAQCC